MEENDYSKTHINDINREIKHIISQAPLKKWTSYKDIYLDYEQSSNSFHYLRGKRSIIGAIEQFDIFERYPDRRRRHQLIPRRSYDYLSSDFKSIIDHYSEFEKKRGKKETTIYSEAHHASQFLLSFQEKGMTSLDKITEKDVIEFFISTDGTRLRGYSYKKSISIFLKTCDSLFSHEDFLRIHAFLPVFREKRKNIQYLTPEEIEKIKGVIKSDDSSLNLRDRAIDLLALYMGLRCCDIAGLTLNSIKWGEDKIQIIQQKTEVPLELPLTAIVGNALYDYITMERPQVDIPEVFLILNPPYHTLQSGSLGNISTKIMNAAKIRQEEGDRKGFHIFRHRVATTLLGNGISQPVISRVLGHTSPDSLDKYLNADFPHLKECALSIENFLIREGVLS